MSDTWTERASDFFLTYVETEDKRAFDANGNMTATVMKQAVDKLLGGHVFTSVADMKNEAARDYNVILPEELFEVRF